MNSTIFVHTNAHEIVSARVAMYALKKTSKNADKFNVKLIKLEDYPHLMKRHGQRCVRNGREAGWYKNVPQSFLPLRFLTPQLMGYKGRAILIDPDIFAISDVYELLSRDMGDKAILSRPVYVGNQLKGYNSSVMLLDCSKLKHWKWEEQIDEMFAGKRDIQDWIWLRTEPEDTIGSLEEEWNHYDIFNETTKFLHNTQQSTQPWKTGLRYKQENMGNYKKGLKDKLRSLKHNFLNRKFSTYKKHPDPNQEKLFFCLLKECLDADFITKKFLESEIKMRHIRPDILSIVELVIN